MQLRTINKKQSQVRVRKNEDGSRHIEGYAAVFYIEGDETTEYQIFDDLIERIMPGAFDDAIKEDDVRALLNHDPNQLLARTGNDLKLSVDNIGLRYEFPVDENDPDHLRTVAKINRGDLSGSSFGFSVKERRWVEFEDYDVMELYKVKLFDVSPATFPAYEGTSVGLRNQDGLDEVRKEYLKWKEERKGIDVDILNRMEKAKAGIK